MNAHLVLLAILCGLVWCLVAGGIAVRYSTRQRAREQADLLRRHNITDGGK